ncbi:MAG: hypothetical protein NC393_04165 [Clostridium sp.]|nr:hypothetical protein [Clostridium sp.]
MFKIVEVADVGYSGLNKCIFIKYRDTDDVLKCAACTEHLTVKNGDSVEIYSDSYVNYRGFGAMALKVLNGGKSNE